MPSGYVDDDDDKGAGGIELMQVEEEDAQFWMIQSQGTNWRYITMTRQWSVY